MSGDATAAIQIAIDGATARPAPARGPTPNLMRLICTSYLALAGWRIRGDWPPGLEKAVLVAAPHTSNWDGLNMLAAAGHYRVRLRWMGKASLTKGPFGWLIKWLGCVPIDRSGSHDVVNAMRDQFATHDYMILAVPPEGTRSAVREWKSGFYHIAVAAGVPLIITVLDYGAKTISLAALVHPSGDYERDLPVIKSYYANARGKRSAKFVA